MALRCSWRNIQIPYTIEMGASFFSQEESMDIRKLETFELEKLINTPDMPEPMVMEALEELNFRGQNYHPTYQDEDDLADWPKEPH